MHPSCENPGTAPRLNTVPVFRFALKVFLHILHFRVDLKFELKIAHSSKGTDLNAGQPYIPSFLCSNSHSDGEMSQQKWGKNLQNTLDYQINVAYEIDVALGI